ncbi:phosphatase PAP2 family protein [Sciscionella sediminilitoris]|uniref:phosphatase PAP2 family protein n=1 Tax=Sciscionella sediminilitoris TaxID=1445613 RepID=UPI00056D6D93|nr:phosphatase PAP2 family protein [Sciscionella sp. SE31]
MSGAVPGEVKHRWLIIAWASIAVAVAVYVLAVLTPVGQALENAALRGADQAAAAESGQADTALGRITVYSLAAAVVVVAAVGLLRRRLDLTIAAVGVIGLGQVVTQALKRFVLPRPELVPVSDAYQGNSLPSGHTTIAMTVLFAVLIVLPHRWRGVAMFFVLSWAVWIGAYTITAKWHRLSDTLAADAVSLAIACFASVWLARRGLVSAYEGPRKIPRVLIAVFFGGVAAASLALGLVLWLVPIGTEGFAETVRTNTWTVYLGAGSLAAAGSILAALVFLASWRRLQTERPDPHSSSAPTSAASSGTVR